ERKIEQKAHHQRRAKALFGRMNSTLDEERGSHSQCDVERRHEAQIQRVRPYERDPFAERAAARVRRNEHPLRASGVIAAEALQLLDKRVHTKPLIGERTRGPTVRELVLPAPGSPSLQSGRMTPRAHAEV